MTRNEREFNGAARGRRGGALVVTLLMATMLMMLGATAAQLGKRGAGETTANVDDRRAFHLAEAALNESWMALQASGSGVLGSMGAPVRLGDGVIWVETEDVGGGLVSLRSTAMVGSGRASARAVVDANEGQPLFRYTIHSDDEMTLNQGVMLDSYDSTLGTYASQVVNNMNGYAYAGDNGDAASNQDIVMNSDATVFGDAIPGPGHVVHDGATGAFVLGSTDPALEPFTYDAIPVPPIPQSGMLAIPANGSETLPPGDYGYDSLIIGNTGTLTVQGPANIVVGGFTGESDGRLVVDATGGPVTIYVRDSYTHIKDFECVAAEGSPMALAFMIEAEQDIVFPAQTAIRGGYYAPNSSILFANDNEAWGSFAARGIVMSSTMRFHYDEALAEYWEDDGGQDGEEGTAALFWLPAAVEPAILRRDRRDPEQVLGVDINQLPTPAEAWPSGGGEQTP